MKTLFNTVIGIDHVLGALILDDQGSSVYDPLDLNPFGPDGGQRTLTALADSSPAIRELDILFENGRLYIRRIDPYILLVLLDARASTAPLKLICGQFTRISAPPKRSQKFWGFLSPSGKK